MMQCLGNAAKADTLFLLQRGDLGAGREITALMAEIEALNVTVQVSVVAPQREGRGRPRTFDPTREQAIKLKRLWHSTLPLHHVLQRASEITGADVKRHQMIYRFGSRWRK